MPIKDVVMLKHLKSVYDQVCAPAFKGGNLKSFALFAGARAISGFLPFALVPILTRYLDPSRYGAFTVYHTLGSFSLPFIGMGMTNYINKYFFQTTRQEMGRIVFNLSVLAFINAAVVSALLLFGLGTRGSFFGIPGAWLMTLPVLTFASVLYQFNWILLRSEKKAGTFFLFEAGSTALGMLLSVLFVVVLLWDWQGRAAAYLLSTAIPGIAALVWMKRSGFFSVSVDRKVMKDAWAMCAPMILHGLGYVVICVSDNLFIDKMLGKDAVGVYAVGYLFGMYIYVLTETFNNIWAPWMYKQMTDMTEEKKKRIVAMTYAYFAALAAACIAGSWAASALLKAMTPAPYHAAAGLVIWVSLAYAAEGMYNMLYPYMIHRGKTRFLGINNGLACAVNLAFNYCLIKSNGILGGAQATLLSFGLMFLAAWWYSNRVYPMPWFSFYKK